MKKIFQSLIVLCLVTVMSCVSAINIKAQDITPYSGGLVSTTQTIKKCQLANTSWKYTDLVDAWAKCNSYTVSRTVTVGTTSTLSVSLTASAKDELSGKMGITYGTSVSTASSIGRTIPADPNRNSKLRHKVQMKKYNVTVTVSSLYYDTSSGYYTLTNDYSGVVTVPNKNESYIEVYYK